MITFQECSFFGYKERTIVNASADATIAFAVDFTTAGEVLTKKSVLSQGKKYIPIDANSFEITESRINTIIDKLNSVSASTVNIAGNGLYTLARLYKPFTQEQIDEFTYNVLNQVINSSKLNNKVELIRSGGQTGFDEAGIKAAVKLGIPALVYCPKGWKCRLANGKDINNEIEFKNRFKI